MKTLLKIFLIVVVPTIIFAQDYQLFDDSPTSAYYDYSWGFANAPSTLEIINGSKFPVEFTNVFSGTNSLRLKWTSKSGGDWAIAAASIGWTGFDITKKDSIVYWFMSNDITSITQLPGIYCEDLANQKTTKLPLSNFIANIKIGQWQKISIPVSAISQNKGNADLTKIKTIFWAQNSNDGIQHIMYIDNIRIISKNSQDITPPQIPVLTIAKGYPRHIDILWNSNSDSDLQGYRLYRKDNGVYKILATVDKFTTSYSDFNDTNNSTKFYKIAAFDSTGNQSELSNEISGTTKQISDNEYLDMVQQATFRYFWNYAHPISGLIRERLNSANTVTIGGTGFGVMGILVGIERNYITRQQGLERLAKIINFLIQKSDRFHGAFPHWMDGETGKVIPFSTYDNGGDLVETAFLIQGLMAVKQYFNGTEAGELDLRNKIQQICNEVEWDWYRKDNGNYLYWHWSPNYAWQINMPIKGTNEAMIVYILATASTTHGVPVYLYQKGWASSNYLNGNSYFGYPLYVGVEKGGPLFFSHYSFLGFDPRNKKDAYTNYFNNNKNHTLINRAYCISNPKGFQGYSGDCWGLTASDNPTGYSAQEPNNDNGTITPTAAISSMPYTYSESFSALKTFYNKYAKDLWGSFGFKDAFNLSQNWFAQSYLAIDQGPILIMIENYRSQLLWNKFMANKEIDSALKKIGFVDDFTANENTLEVPKEFRLYGNYPNPFNPSTKVLFSVPNKQNIVLNIYNIMGQLVKTLSLPNCEGKTEIIWDATNNLGGKVTSGIYIYSIQTNNNHYNGKMVLMK